MLSKRDPLLVTRRSLPSRSGWGS